MKKKLKIANLNGKKLGYALGYKEGYQFAYKQLAEELKETANHKIKLAKTYKPVIRSCWNCASGLVNKIKE